MFKTKTISKNIDESQLSHTKWNCMFLDQNIVEKQYMEN